MLREQTAEIMKVAGEPGAYPRKLRAQGEEHAGRGANSSQGTITHYRQFGNANRPTAHVFGLREETGVPVGTPRALGEHANSAHTETVPLSKTRGLKNK
ncbi:hypothetical protein AMELA_G00102530 [Ameiurus melas]|uniref:Uncharacterized protein n=1 Tax=Ameiurus melas TaxID=219545 RepID=A0A7J6AT66_AMEME|nr:hypothetical protein AMELA_G00102530 [Ameiurus melas]